MYLPASTYRVQLHKGYTFKDLKKIIPYLHQLGVSTVYASPITTSTSGSMHGYDVTNPDIINPEIGTEEEFAEIIQQMNEYNMSWLQDIVPNHMAYSSANTRLMDVFERGNNSSYYNYFDINWNHFDQRLKGKVMNPVLGSDLEQCTDNNEVKIVFNKDGLSIAYYDNVFPASVISYANVLAVLEPDRTDQLTQLETQVQEMLLKAETTDFDAWDEFKKVWTGFIFSHDEYKQQIDQALEKINADKELLKLFLQQQNFAFTNWRLSEQEMNYRRFFTVNSLICLRMEDEFVFSDYHKLLKRLYDKGYIRGLRIDHIDGLYNPKQYVERLRKLFGEDCYIIAEKILEYNEDVAKDWDLQGTSGYEFLSFTNQLLTDKEGSKKILDYYKKLVSGNEDYHDMVFEKKQNFLYDQMNGELDNLLRYAEELNVFNVQLNRGKMRTAIGTFMSAFPVYRIYIDSFPVTDESMEFVSKAFEKSLQKSSEVTNELNALKNIFETKQNDASAQNKLLFLMRLMQFTSPLAAKGVEDTTFYVYNPLISHNEVGDSPSILGISVDEFHQKMINRQQNNPYSLNASSTHDTKRGEDARMRLNALSEIPDEWIRCVEEWREKNKSLIQNINGKSAPSANDEYFIYQSLIGSFPEDLKVTDTYIQRSKDFIQKALREAKVETNYSEPNSEYEDACKNFVEQLLKNENGFLDGFIPFTNKLIDYATVYSLVQVLIKATAPGIQDTYQGCELWDLSYVDPDNRRPIDFDCRIEALNEIKKKEKTNVDGILQYIAQQKKEGREKLFVTYKALNLRRTNNELFIQGEYIPLQVTNGEREVIAFARKHNNKWAVAILPVAIANKLRRAENILDKSIWGNIRVHLPKNIPSKWRNVFTNERINVSGSLPLSNMFTKFSVALLESE